MTNRAARHRANKPGMPVVKRTKTGLTFDMQNGTKASICGLAPLHKGLGPFTEADEIDTAWQANDLLPYVQYQYKQDTGDYFVLAGSNPAFEFDSGQVVMFVHEGTGEEIAYTAQALQWTNDLGQISQIAIPTAAVGTVDDFNIDFQAAYGPELDFRWMSTATALRKELLIHQRTAIGDTPPAFIIAGGNPVLRLQFIFTVSNNVDVLIDGGIWDKKTEAQTPNSIEFRDATTDELLWMFFPPTATDDNDDKVGGTMELDKRGPSLFVRIDIPWSWLETAMYPVRVDPTTSVFTGAGDGNVEGFLPSTTWDAVHDMTPGDSATYTDTTITLAIGGNGGNNNRFIDRVAVPADTSAIGTDIKISGTFNAYVTSTANGDNDGDDWITMVETFQASASVLVVADYQDIGSDNGTGDRAYTTPIEEGNATGDREDITGLSTSAYFSIPFNALGLTWVNGSGTTMMGIREGHDVLDSAYTLSGGFSENKVIISSSEATGTSQDPYYEIVHRPRRIAITHT